jgi:hypothetical protein
MLLMVACNLGLGTPGDPEATPTVEVLIPQVETPVVEETQAVEQSGDPQVAQTFGPVTVTGEFTVGSTVSIRVKRGDAVSGVQCLINHQESSGTTVLDPPTPSGPGLDGTFDEVFTFEPDQGGTYSASCTGNALTLDQGLLEVEANSSAFTVEAKG